MFHKSAYYFIGLLVLAVAGFWQSYFSKLFGDINLYVHFHAVTMLLWIFMLISQVFLIKYKHITLHRYIGKFSYALVPTLTISLILLSHSQITIHDYGISYNRLYIIFLQLSLLVIFLTAYIMAIINRKSASHHVRYMICTSLTLIDPAVARLPLNIPPLPFSYQVLTFAITDIILLTLIYMERKQNRAREVFPVMLIIFIIFQVLNLSWTESEVWDKFSMWFAKLPLT